MRPNASLVIAFRIRRELTVLNFFSIASQRLERIGLKVSVSL